MFREVTPTTPSWRHFYWVMGGVCGTIGSIISGYQGHRPISFLFTPIFVVILIVEFRNLIRGGEDPPDA